MLEQLKSTLDKTGEFLEDLVEKVEDEAEDFAEDSKALWQQSKQRVGVVKARLEEASKKLEANTDEARLQAHLAAMDAHDQWQHLQHSVSAFVQHAEEKSRPVLDHAALQAHLAKMDASDFMEASGKELKEKFEASREKTEQASLKAATEIKDYCEGLIAGLPK